MVTLGNQSEIVCIIGVLGKKKKWGHYNLKKHFKKVSKVSKVSKFRKFQSFQRKFACFFALFLHPDFSFIF